MLTITRRVGESFIIDTGSDIIEIIITELRGSNVRVGIDADEKITILRKELTEEYITKQTSKKTNNYDCNKKRNSVA